jgi:hypothetical protein
LVVVFHQGGLTRTAPDHLLRYLRLKVSRQAVALLQTPTTQRYFL